MEQPTFADLVYDAKKRQTRREIFLERMDGLIPWQKLEERIRPFYAKPGQGRRPYPLPVMLRIHCVQLFYTRIPHLAQTSDAVNRQLSCFSSRYMNLLAVFQI